ncbi:putative protein kinase AGC-NDR family [Helianthus annuus]|nr:putative protein kinase AGC-NDR family [Helianthus annuus]
MRLQRHQIGIDDFKLLTLISKGAFREVRLCRAKTSEVFAMKKLKKSDMLRVGRLNMIDLRGICLWRDIKPDNLILDRNRHLKLSDFGLCKSTESKFSSILLNEEDYENQGPLNDIDGQQVPWLMSKKTLIIFFM